MLQKSVKSGLIAAHTKEMFFFPLCCGLVSLLALIEHHFQTMKYVAVYIDEHCDKKNGKKIRKYLNLKILY